MSMIPGLSRFPRCRLLGETETPIELLETTSAALAAEGHHVRLYVKRDDVALLGGGGNKLRKLEFLLGDALAAGADTVLTFGGLQSNHARLTAAAAARSGLACELILSDEVPRDDRDYHGNGNLVLDELFGATLHRLRRGANADDFARDLARTLEATGRRPYTIPVGGSNALGGLGYVACAAEIAMQETRLGIVFDRVVVANGSGGTHAGLAAGFSLLGRPRAVQGYAVYRDAIRTADGILDEARATLALLGSAERLEREDIVVDGHHLGEGYGIPTTGMIDALRFAARTQGLLLDPVYTGKAFAGLLGDIRAGAYREAQTLLFIHTGGLPGLFAYAGMFTGGA